MAPRPSSRLRDHPRSRTPVTLKSSENARLSSTVASLAMTAYLQRRMRSSRQHDLNGFRLTKPREQVLSLVAEYFCLRTGDFYGLIPNGTNNATAHEQIGRASCRERVQISVVTVSLKKQ